MLVNIQISVDGYEAIEKIRPMIEAYRRWTTGGLDASQFGRIADRAILDFEDEMSKRLRGLE